MTPPKPSPKPRSASPADRSADNQAHQAKLKEEAAARRAQQAAAPSGRKPRPTASHG
jgi:hypothetical protein